MRPTTDLALEPEVYRWKRRDFRDFLGSGVVDDAARFELLDGLIFRRPMENPSHSLACGLAQDALLSILTVDFHLRCQHPLALEDRSEPEPDLAVIRGRRRDFQSDHPQTAELIIEVSDTTLHIDRGRKLLAYARNRIPEYWIVNLLDRQLEVHRMPSLEAEAFLELKILKPADSVSPLFRPDCRIEVSGLLP